ncbi:hypothetical protein, partial [Actinoallomurus acaciae]
MACWMPRRRPHARPPDRVRDGETILPASAAVDPTVRRVSLARIRAQGRFSVLLSVLLGRAADLAASGLDRGPARLRGLEGLRRLAA